MLRANPTLRRLVVAWAQSCLGTGAGYVALLLLTYRYLHSPWAIAVVLVADFLPAMALGSWFGACADRYPRRRLIVAGNLMQAAAFAGLAVAHTAAPIITLALLAGTGNAMLRPALRAALPGVAGPSTQTAIALYETCRYAGISLGPVIAAGLFAISNGVALPLALNALSFLVAAAMMASLRLAASPESRVPGSSAGFRVREGLRTAFASPAIAVVIACSAGVVLAGGLLNVCEPILATHVLGGSGSDFALLVGIYGIGMVTASTLVARRGTMPADVLIRRYLLALMLEAAGMAASASAAGIPTAAVAFAGTGYANALLVVSQTQLIQLRVPTAVQGRLFGAKDAVEGACFLVALLAAGALIEGAGVRFTLATGAGICGACALIAATALRGETRAATHAGALAERRNYAANGRAADAVVATVGASASAFDGETTSRSA